MQDGVTGYVVPDGDPLLLSQKLTHLIQNPDLLNRLGNQAAEYALNYRWENITQQILDVYHQLI